MQELIAQLIRLYLPAGGAAKDELEEHIAGRATRVFDLAQGGAVRTIVIPFDRQADGGGDDQWERLCRAANVLQGELGLPAPAVSIDGATGFRLWLSFGEPVPVAQAQRFVDLLRAAYCSDVSLPADVVVAPVALPPCLNTVTGKWAAFIHPGMGASFADEPALEMAPPAAAQAAFLQGLESIGAAEFRHALDILRRTPEPPTVRLEPAAAHDGVPQGLLLKDATLDDIVRYLHAKNIEPTFRHLLPPG